MPSYRGKSPRNYRGKRSRGKSGRRRSNRRKYYVVTRGGVRL